MNTNTPLFFLTRWPHGWTLCAPPGQSGVPLTALSECMPLMPKGATMHGGISHHLRFSAYPETVLAIVTPREGKRWEKEITASIAHLHPEERWWRGLDVGTSSASIFAVFQENHPSIDFGRGSTPSDASDIGRCFRLLDLFPDFETQLEKVAETYPSTHWPRLIARWPELKTNRDNPDELNRILQEIRNQKD